jgi:hypothetical protein
MIAAHRDGRVAAAALPYEVMSRIASTLSTARETVLASWAHRYDRSPRRGPGAKPAREHAAIASGLLESLAVALDTPTLEVAIGTPPLRDLEKAAVFAGATWAVDGGTGFEIATILNTLRDAVLEYTELDAAPVISELFEWLSILALDAYATAGRRAISERAAEQLEAGTPVLLLLPEIPGVLLVGSPTEDALDSILARAMLLVVRVGAPTLILDITGLADPTARPMQAAMARLFEHRRMSTVQLAVIGAPTPVADAWKRAATAHNVSAIWFERFDDAFAHAAGRAGISLVRRSPL